MRYDEIDLPPTLPLKEAARAIDEVTAAQGLRITSLGTLGEYPGSIHWHVKRGKEAGTLEITLLNRERRLQFSVRDNRQGPWTEAGLEAVSDAVRARLVPDAPIPTPNAE